MIIEGARGLLVSEVKKGKLEEFLERLRKGLVMFSEVEGATASVELWNTQIETLASLGRKPPEELKVD